MDYTNKEAVIAEKTEFQPEENQFASLSEFQLAFVGGGNGEVILQ